MSSAPPGYHGRYLRIDATTRTSSEVALDESLLRRFIGGAGLATALLLRECPDDVPPLSAEAPLVFAFSPLVGSPLTTSAKFTVASKSPLTLRINDSLSSSTFAIAGKKSGYDAIVIVGACDDWSLLVIDNDEVRFEPAEELRGLPARTAEAHVRERGGNRFRVAAIGPAGENLVHYATLSHDGRHAARGGLGAVLGSKRIKAITIAGNRPTQFAHPGELAEYSRRLSELSFGPATAKYRELGTVSNLLTFNRLGTLPTRNFQSGEFAGAAALSPEGMQASHPRTRTSCAACTIGCEHIFHQEGKEGVRLEYETLFALGPLCGVSDPDAVLDAARYCDEAGLDTISAGATIGFAMECAERGLIDAPGLRFGDGAALLSLLRQIASREGWGGLLSQGVRAAARQIGQGADKFAPHVKGLELPGYEPRALQTIALGFAVGARGADHNRSGAYQADLSERVDRLAPGDAAVRLAIETEDEAALLDSLILCKFVRGVFDDRAAAMADMLRLVTGWDISPDELAQTARRIVTAKKWFNIRQGWTPEEDTLPRRFFDAELSEGASRGARLSEATLGSQVRAYNLARGWSAEGWIEQSLVTDLGIPTIVSRETEMAVVPPVPEATPHA